MTIPQGPGSLDCQRATVNGVVGEMCPHLLQHRRTTSSVWANPSTMSVNFQPRITTVYRSMTCVSR